MSSAVLTFLLSLCKGAVVETTVKEVVGLTTKGMLEWVLEYAQHNGIELSERKGKGIAQLINEDTTIYNKLIAQMKFPDNNGS